MIKRSLILCLAIVMLIMSLVACDFGMIEPDDPNENESSSDSASETESNAEAVITDPVDYASSVKPGEDSVSIKMVVRGVHNYIDGDTTHFDINEMINGKNIVKARYLAVDTPESTGKIEEWGKAASNFTKETLKNAHSIMIESDTRNWEVDSTGDRCLLWIWYKSEENAEWRNLNIELLQNGLAIASNSGNNRYGSVCLDAIAQAKALKLNIYSGEKDPGFFYGDAIEITLKELRRNIEDYADVKVSFTGVVTLDSNNGVYVESYDEETEMYYAIYVYYGFNLSALGLEILTEGNEVRVIGTVQPYNGSWQVAGVSCNAFKPDDPNNLQLISSGHTPGYQDVSVEEFLEGKITFDNDDGTTYSRDFAELAMDTSISIRNLTVESIYTTESENDSSNGAMTITCSSEGKTITVRTNVLFDEDGKKVTADAFEYKTIDVDGVVGYFNGEYQIKVVAMDGISVH